MKKLLLMMTLFFAGAAAHAQIVTPVKWAYAAKKLGNNEVMILMKATIDEGWHIYSLNVKDGGPIKTSFTFPASKEYTVVGKPVEPKAISKYEESFKMDVSYFEKSVVFQQKIKLKAGKATTVKGKLEYMTCNNQKCLPPEDLDFSVQIP